MNSQTYVGIDGCRAGWMAIKLSASSAEVQMDVFRSIVELWKEHHTAHLLLLDMPIGLKSSGTEERSCDLLARKLLSPYRTSSIFPAPVRGVLDAVDYAEANVINRQMGGRGLSKQTWHLVPKIREVDSLLRSEERARFKLRESHPEVCFASLFGAPMVHNKRTEEGFRERMDHLQALYPDAADVVGRGISRYRRRDVARHDLVDALVLALSGMISGGELASLPERPERDTDACGLGMAIWYARRELKG